MYGPIGLTDLNSVGSECRRIKCCNSLSLTVDDYTPVITNVVFASGRTTAIVDVTITNDMIFEGDEMFSATLVSQEPNVMVHGGSSNADITIFDDDRKFSPAEREAFIVNYGHVVGNTLNKCNCPLGNLCETFFLSYTLLLLFDRWSGSY